jgi:membrane-associated phospholipid phosphatase
MRKPFLVAVLATASTWAAAARADVVTDWNGAALAAIRAGNTSPPAASRNLAILHAAIYDAVNGVRQTHEPYLVAERAPPGASPDAAAIAAAHAVLTALYPADAVTFDALRTRQLVRERALWPREAGSKWGAQVAAAILAARVDDGAAATAPWPGSDEPGKWRPTVSFGGIVRPALLPLWGRVRPFALESGSRFRPPAPPVLDSERYAADVARVQAFGRLDSAVRTTEQTEIALFWAYGPGSATPPGHWNQIAQGVARRRGDTVEQNARLFALLNLALADAAIVSWECKYAFDLWRPITAIQLADTDGNPLTHADPSWTPLLPTPPFPEYTSGHSTFSGAAAVVLALFYGRDRIEFDAVSDDLPGVIRSYEGFWDAALESGASRVYGGIHFPSANVRGLLTGARTGAYVSHRYLLPKSRRHPGGASS